MSHRRQSRRDRTSQKKRRYRLSLLLAGVAALGLGAVIGVDWRMASTAGANPNDPAQVSMGRTVYAENCASCHGVRLEGQPNWRIRKPDGRLPAPPHDETGHTWHHPDEQLFRITRLGLKPPLAPEGYKSDMPAFEGALTDEEIWAVLAFIKNAWPPRIRQRQDRRSQGAKR